MNERRVPSTRRLRRAAFATSLAAVALSALSVTAGCSSTAGGQNMPTPTLSQEKATDDLRAYVQELASVLPEGDTLVDNTNFNFGPQRCGDDYVRGGPVYSSATFDIHGPASEQSLVTSVHDHFTAKGWDDGGPHDDNLVDLRNPDGYRLAIRTTPSGYLLNATSPCATPTPTSAPATPSRNGSA
jgi:hypothetical protein